MLVGFPFKEFEMVREDGINKWVPETIMDTYIKNRYKPTGRNRMNYAAPEWIEGKTKGGIFGDEFFVVNEKIVDLSNPLITEDGKNVVNEYYSETLDPDGRGHRNVIRMMMEDGFFKFLPKGDNNWVNFLTPFLKLTRKEKRKYKK